LINGVTFEQLA